MSHLIPLLHSSAPSEVCAYAVSQVMLNGVVLVLTYSTKVHVYLGYERGN